ncbi:hypothetical protein ACFL5A_00235 [Gemmatimonadota bacterium]
MGAILSTLLLILFSGVQDEPVRIPPGTVPEIDGFLSPGEWDDALRLPFSGGEAVLLKESGGNLFVGVHGATGGFVSLGFGGQDSLKIFHASTALITASFVRHGETWERTHGFTEALAEGGTPYPRSADRTSRGYMDAQYEQFGWTANVVTLGPPTDPEFKIRVSDHPLRATYLSVVMYQARAATRVARAPDMLEDASIDPDLLQGSAGPVLDFDPHGWIRVIW